MNEEEKKAIKLFKYIHIDREKGTLGLCTKGESNNCNKMNGAKNCQECIEKAKEIFCDFILKLGESK